MCCASQNCQGFHDADSIFNVAVDLVRAILYADLVAVVADMEKNHVVVILVAHAADKVVVLHITCTNTFRWRDRSSMACPQGSKCPCQRRADEPSSSWASGPRRVAPGAERSRRGFAFQF
jgi:hypothetical protein